MSETIGDNEKRIIQLGSLKDQEEKVSREILALGRDQKGFDDRGEIYIAVGIMGKIEALRLRRSALSKRIYELENPSETQAKTSAEGAPQDVGSTVNPAVYPRVEKVTDMVRAQFCRDGKLLIDKQWSESPIRLSKEEAMRLGLLLIKHYPGIISETYTDKP